MQNLQSPRKWHSQRSQNDYMHAHQRRDWCTMKQTNLDPLWALCKYSLINSTGFFETKILLSMWFYPPFWELEQEKLENGLWKVLIGFSLPFFERGLPCSAFLFFIALEGFFYVEHESSNIWDVKFQD